MKVLALVAAIFAIAAAQQHCVSPPQWEGFARYVDPERADFGVVDISYDASDQRIRLIERIAIVNTTRPVVDYFEQILLFKEKVLYRINLKTQECEKVPLTQPFQPIEVPADAHFRGEEWVGVENLTGAGFLTELWVGSTPRGRFAGQWSAALCIPILESYITFGPRPTYTHSSFYNITLGIKDMNVFKPPSYC